MAPWGHSKPTKPSLSARFDDDEAALLSVRSSMSPSSSTLDDPDDLEKAPLADGKPRTGAGSKRSSVGELRRLRPQVTVKPWVLRVAGAVAIVVVVVVWWHLRQTEFDPTSAGPDRGRPWIAFGNSQVVDLSSNRGKRLPLCERTMLIDWRSFAYGFGSTATTILHAGVVANMHNYTLLFERGANKYGRYLDFFEPAPLRCHAPEEYYDPEFYRRDRRENGTTANLWEVINDDFERPSINRVIVDPNDIHPLNHHFKMMNYPNISYLDTLPPLDASKPVPVSSNVPDVFYASFERYAAVSSEHFALNALLRAKVNAEVSRLDLDRETRTVPSIGVHWRGGDKLARECVASSQLSCGNVTHHCVTALDALPAVHLSNPTLSTSEKPRILLMTTEPDALALFRQDDVCRQFDVELLEADAEEKQSFIQDEWNALSDAARAADAQSMFVGTELLANYVDAAVVSPNSNLGRVIFARAGPRRVTQEGLLRSVDIYWHPVHYPPFKATETWGGCDGTWGGCWPSN
ncbi:hypothetical protein JCM10212_004348 [Sporobolomyces blumeae]